MWPTSTIIREGCCRRPNLPMAYLNGSPLARSWNLFHNFPSSWEFEPGEDRERPGTSNGIPELKFLSIALSRAIVCPSELLIGEHHQNNILGIAPHFDSSGWLALQETLDIAYRNLTHLKIHFATSFAVDAPLIYTDMSVLGRLLVSLTGLECLF